MLTGTVVETVWTFDDGGFSYDPNPTKLFHVPGVYDVHLTVVDDDGDSTTCTVPIIVGTGLPGTDAGVSDSGVPGTDMGVPGTDAGTPGSDAGDGGGGGGCRCRVGPATGISGPDTGAVWMVVLLAAAFSGRWYRTARRWVRRRHRLRRPPEA